MPREYTSPSGATILVGKDAHDNERLTFVLAKATDTWFHVSSFPGAHVVLVTPESPHTIQEQDILFAAELAAKHSKAAAAVNQKSCLVDCCLVIDVTKPKNAPTGMVEISNARTLTVDFGV